MFYCCFSGGQQELEEGVVVISLAVLRLIMVWRLSGSPASLEKRTSRVWLLTMMMLEPRERNRPRFVVSAVNHSDTVLIYKHLHPILNGITPHKSERKRWNQFQRSARKRPPTSSCHMRMTRPSYTVITLNKPLFRSANKICTKIRSSLCFSTKKRVIYCTVVRCASASNLKKHQTQLSLLALHFI